MAKRRRPGPRAEQRGTIDASNARLLLDPSGRDTDLLRFAGDARFFYPSHNPVDYPNPRRLDGSTARVIVYAPKRSVSRGTFPSTYSVPQRISFAAPKAVAVCVRRKQRKEVLFAIRKTGKGARARRKLTRYSGVSCR